MRRVGSSIDLLTNYARTDFPCETKLTKQSDCPLIRITELQFITKWTIFTARKRSFRRLCFYRCLSFCPQGGRAWLLWGGWCVWLLWGVAGMCGCSQGGACVVAPGGVRGCSRGACVVAPGGCAWLLPGGHAWLLLGGHVWLLLGEVGRHAWFSRGACMVFWGGMHGFFDEIRSMSGR